MLDQNETPTEVVICADGGTWTIYYANKPLAGARVTGNLTGYRNRMDEAITFARARGVLLIDWRTADTRRAIRAVISGPMNADAHDTAPDPAPWHGLSYAPAWYCAELARLAGATVENAPPIPADAAHLTPTAAWFEKESA